MKKALLLALLGIACFGFTIHNENTDNPKRKYYYFCLSREVPLKEELANKPQVVYTDIYAITGDEADMRKLTNQFASFINKQCKPGNERCTSDLNYYPDLQEAEKHYKEIVTKYAQAGQYVVKRIDFEGN